MRRKIIKIFELIFIVLLIAGAIWLINRVGVEQIRNNVAQLGVWTPFIIMLLRLFCIVVPVFPGTAYAILAGALFGFAQGLVIIAIADFLACSVNFVIARHYGREVVQRFVGRRFMDKLDLWSKKYLGGNFLLLTGAMMSIFFDYISYGAGLVRVPWQRFMSALGLSIVLARPPLVAVGAGVLQGEKLLIGTSVVGVLAIAIISAWTRRKAHQTTNSD